MNDPQLTQCLQLLLQDEVIYSYRYSALCTFLGDDASRARVAQTLQLIGRDVRQTSDYDAYVCCYDNISAPEVTTAGKERFKRVVQDLQRLVQWLCLVMDCTPNGTPMRRGDNYSKNDVLSRIEQSHSLCERLASKLIRLLDQAVRADRQMHTSHNVAMYWRDLNGCLADYKKSISPSDIDMNRTALQECAAKLIEEIRFAIDQFGRFIERGYAYAQSADIRLQQNERTLAKAQELVEMMESFDLVDYQRATRTEDNLRALFFRHLPNAQCI
ncbi:MAG: hypothetical protein ACI9BO_002406 [Zhongshania sp.]|jgi:hypothetical protein